MFSVDIVYLYRQSLITSRQPTTTKVKSQPGNMGDRFKMHQHLLRCPYLSVLMLLFFLLCLPSSANKCLLKVATYAAQLEQYQKAIEIYEQVSIDSILMA